MFMTLNPIGNRVAVVATLVLGLFLLAGCSDEPDTHASAAEDATERREVVLSVPDMTCPTCPVTVRRSLGGVDGVYEADADLDTKEARAVFDPARTDVDMLIAAVRNSGFSATLKGESNE